MLNEIAFTFTLLNSAASLSMAAENAPGVTDSEIKIGQTMSYTGPAARFSALGLAEIAYTKNGMDYDRTQAGGQARVLGPLHRRQM